MYYKEKVINGELCYQTAPDGPWVPYTIQQLTDMVKSAEDKYNELRGKIAEFNRNLVDAIIEI